MREVYQFLKGCGVYYLAPLEKDQPRVRPFGTIDLYEDKLYIQTGKIKEVSKQMKLNPKIEISATSNDGRWIRISANAILDNNIKAQEHMLNEYPNLKSMYAANDGNTEVYFLENGCATIYSFTEKPRQIKF